MGERILYLVRHGQYHQNHTHQDDLGGGLTEMGSEQAWMAAQALASLPIKHIYTSPLRRAIETADIIAGVFPGIIPEREDTLHEVVPTIPSQEAEFFARHFPELTADRVIIERRDAEKAFDRFFVPASGDDVHEVLICHGNIIRYFACRVLGVPIDAWTNMETNHCGLTCCTIAPQGRMLLTSLNDIGHLPHNLRTFM
ncbi:MAG: histidine phosphatase family protein [Anaerolineaceae bacterium]|nr:histidine phosphatase family protein [Anaerolineaceae bacterium]